MELFTAWQSAVVVLLQFTLFIGICTACSETEGWQPMPITSRAGGDTVDFAILGNVTQITPPRSIRRFGGTVYGAEVAVECVYKKAPQQNIYGQVTVIGFGETHDCTNTEVEENHRYIFFMSPFQSGYAVVEYNDQVAAESATDDNIQAMLSTFQCQVPSQPTTPPPTTTPLTTTTITTLPTTKPSITVPIATVVTKPVEAESRDKPSGGTAAHLSCLAVLFAVMSWLAFVSPS